MGKKSKTLDTLPKEFDFCKGTFLEERVRNILNSDFSSMNNLDTTLYLLGIIPNEGHVHIDIQIMDSLTKNCFEQIANPEFGDLVIWEFNEYNFGLHYDSVYHTGIITNSNPITVLHKTNGNLEVQEMDVLDKIPKYGTRNTRYYSRDSIDVEYLKKQKNLREFAYDLNEASRRFRKSFRYG